MEIRISIDERLAFVLLIALALVSVVGITMAAPPNPGHSWTDVECLGCIATGNIANNAVTASKVQFNYAGSSSEGGAATSAQSVDWGNIDNLPSGFSDGVDNNYPISCSWSGWLSFNSLTCSYGCAASAPLVNLYCSAGRVTQARSESYCVECLDYGGY
jgi:hypothetical protein